MMKPVFFLILALTITLSALGSIPSSFAVTSDTLYSCARQGEFIYAVSTSTGQTTSSNAIVVNAGSSAWTGIFDKCLGLATDPTDGQMFALIKDSSGDRFLATLDPTTGSMNVIEEFLIGGFSHVPNHIGFDSLGQMYSTESVTSGSGFNAVDKTTAVVSVAVCTLPTVVDSFYGGLALNQDDGEMYLLHKEGIPLDLIKVDITQADCIGTTTTVAGGFLGGDFPQDMTYDTNISEFVIRDNDGATHHLFSLDTSGFGTDIGDETLIDMRGLAFALSGFAPPPPVTQVTSDVLYSCAKDGSAISVVNTSTGQRGATEPMNSNVDVGSTSYTNPTDKCLGLATDPTDNQMYALLRDDLGGRYLAKVDPTTGDVIIVEEFLITPNINFDPNHLAFDITGQMYGTETKDAGTGAIYKIDKTTAFSPASPECSLDIGVDDFHGGFTLNYDDEEMYVLHKSGSPNDILKIDIGQANCEASRTTLSGYALDSFVQDMTYNTATSKFIARGNDAITHDLSTFGTNGVATNIGDETNDDQRGLAFTLLLPAGNQIPVLTLVGSASIQLNLNDAYVEQGATCLDDEDGQIDGNVVIGGSVNTSIVGMFNLTYDCQDSGGADAVQLVRTVTVVDPDAVFPSGVLFTCDKPNEGNKFRTVSRLTGNTGGIVPTINVGSSGFNLPYVGCLGMASDPTSGVMYAIAKSTSGSDRYLATLDFKNSNEYILDIIGDVTLSGSAFFPNNISFDSSGQMFTSQSIDASNPNDLHKVDKSTGVVTVAPECTTIAPNQYNFFAYNSDNEKMYHVFGASSSQSHFIGEVDLNEADCNSSGYVAFDTEPNFIMDMSYDSFLGEFWLQVDKENPNQDIWRIDPLTGTVTIVGTDLNDSAQRGMAFELITEPILSGLGSVGFELTGGNDIREIGNAFEFEIPKDLAVVDNRAYMTWVEDDGATQILLVAVAVDGVWGTPIEIFESGSLSFDIEDRQMIVDGTDVHIFAILERAGNVRDYALFTSTNGGVSFNAPVFIQLVVSADHTWADVVGNTINVVYGENNKELYYERSTDNGASFGGRVQITDNVGSSFAEPNGNLEGVALDSSDDGTSIWVAWNTVGFSQSVDNVYESHSTNSGVTFSTPTEVSNTGIQKNEGKGIGVEVFHDGSEVLIIFDGITGVSTSILAQAKSVDGGVTYSAQEDIEVSGLCDWDGFEFKSFSQDEIDPSVIHTICIEPFDPLPTNVYTTHTDDFGDNWTTIQSLMDNPPAVEISNDNWVVEVNGDDVFYGFSIEGLTLHRTILQSSTDGGHSFVGEKILLETALNEDIDWLHIEASDQYVFLVADINAFFSGTFNLTTLISWFQFMALPNEIPVITITGASTINLAVNDFYLEQGATCLDTEDGSIVVNIGGDTIDTSVAGIFSVTYDCEDSGGLNAVQVTRTVSIANMPQVELFHVDLLCEGDSAFDLSEIVEFLTICPIQGADPPDINLLGNAIEEILVGDVYVDAGATAFDNGDGDVTSNIATVGASINTSVAGVFFVTYNVSDSLGNDAVERIRTVVVVTVQAGTGGGGGGVGQGSDVSGIDPVLPPIDIEDLDTNQIDDLLAMLAPALENTIIQEIIQTFFEFQVIDKEHNDVVIQSFLPNEQLGIRWSTGDDIVVTSVVPASSPFTFSFEQVPIIKRGSGSAISENAVSYNLQIPSVQCGEEFSFECVDTIRYSVPVTVFALINGTEVNAVGTILVDLSVEDINPILIILFFTVAIPIVAGVIWKIRGGHNPSKVSDLLQ